MIRFGECWGILAAILILIPVSLALWPPLAAVLALLALFTLYFFRDPERAVPQGEGILLCPADGRVLYVEETNDPYVGEARRLAIFMSPFDVHVNRSPLACKVGRITHTPGRRVAAYLRGDLTARERNRLELEGRGRIAVEQYAGVVARRIVCFAAEGQELAMGGRFGMIMFGSRVDVIAPLSVEIKVSTGERVVAGETKIGEFTNG
jgi:phosphatidylserine decarboxylase